MSATRKRFIKEINKAMGEDVAAELSKLAEQARAIGRGELLPIGHTHTDSCYSRVPETEGKGEWLSCGKVAGQVEDGLKNIETYQPNYMSQTSMDDYDREDA